MLTEQEREDIVKYKLARATETWTETVGIVQAKYWYAAANRMYYTCYYVTSALLIKYGYSATTHSGVIRMLGQNFVTTGILPKEMGSLYSHLFELRQTGDYDEWKEISEEDILPLIPQIEKYLDFVRNLIKSK